MSSSALFVRLQRLTGRLSASPDAPADELTRFERILAEYLHANPDLVIRGNRLPLDALDDQSDLAASFEARIGRLEEMLAHPASAETATSPLIFRRETAFRSNLLGHSVPDWAAGMAPSATYGPFVDEHGLTIWFDLFLPLTLASVYFSGGSAPVLRVPMWGFLTGSTSYRIEAGSAWIASELIAQIPALQGHYTGLTISGGRLELSQPATVSGGHIVLAPKTRAALHLALLQPASSHVVLPAGADAASAEIQLPKTFDLRFQLNASSLDAGTAAFTIFGCTTKFERTAQAPIWAGALSQILVPFSAKTEGNAPDHFEVVQSKSKLCTLEGRAAIDATATGWLLPATKADPQTLGTAAGAGAMCLTLKPGLTATWIDLKGAKSALTHPSIIVEPALATVFDLTAANVNGHQRWTLWRNAANPHASQITLTFGKTFPFLFVSSAADSEGVFCFCGHKAAIDRPVDANGNPFVVQSSVAFMGTLQTGKTFHALLFDNDLLFDGGPGTADVFREHSLVLRNALFTVSRPRSLALFGDLENGRLTKGVLALTHDVHLYLPTLPDPYVASYTPSLRDPAAIGLGHLQQSLTGFVKWPLTAPLPAATPDPGNPRAFVYFKFTPLVPQPQAVSAATRDFQTGVPSFNQDLVPHAVGQAAIMIRSQPLGDMAGDRAAANAATLSGRVVQAARSGELRAAVAELEKNPLLGHLANKTEHVNLVLEASLRSAQNAEAASFLKAPSRSDPPAILGRATLAHDLLMLLDVSTHADQMGVTLGPALKVGRDERGGAMLQAKATSESVAIAGSALPLQIMNMDVVTSGQSVRAAMLPQVSWEPIFNIPLAIEGPPDPADSITVTPGLVVYANDGVPTRVFSESPYPVPIAPLPVTRHFLKEFNDDHTPRPLHSVFTLPFAMVAEADFNRSLANPANKNARLDFNMPHFDRLRGGLQIKARAPVSGAPDRISPSFAGWTIQLDNIRWALFGVPLSGSTLGATVREIFNRKFQPGGNQPTVPLERIELSGYGASIFSNWLNADATVADVSQTQFDVVMGRTAHEVVQVRSILYPFGVHVVRTITLMRSNNGYVFRSDSGWKAESDGFYDFSYTLDLQELGTRFVANPYEFHSQPVNGVSRVREIRDFPTGGAFSSSFQLDDPDLPPALKALTLTEWQKLFANATSKAHKLDVHMQAVVFDADVHLDNVLSGGTNQGADVVVQSRKMLGYVQLAPTSVILPARIFADLLNFQNGSLGGPVDCIIDVAKSKQRMRVQRVDVNPAVDAAGKNVFVTAARGSLILPADGSWSVVKQQTDTGDVKPVPVQEMVPLIKPNASPNFLLSHPADVHQPKSNTHYCVLQSTGTQKLLFDVPQFSPGVPKLKSAQTYFADAYKLLNSKGVFPNIGNALGLTNAEREAEILGEGQMRMAERTLKLDTLLPANYIYPFIDEPGVLRVYAQYKSTDNTSGQLALGIDSAAALEKRWKAALSNMRVVVDLGPFTELMWVDGHFDAASGARAAYDKPHLQFGPVLQPVVDILQVLATLSGEDFDRGMSVGMSNSADNWEYKFNCSKEIPVIKFPSPEQLTINPNPPLKLEAGLKVGFYFNEVLSVPTDLKQLVPACGAYVEFYGGIEVQCFTLAIASVYGVGHVTLGIAADSKAGITLHMKFGFGAEVVVGLPVVANVSVLYMVEVEVTIADNALDVAGLMLFRGAAEICGGLVAICIQIEAGGSVHRAGASTTLTAQVTFSIDVCVLWVIDIDVTEHWQEQRQIA